MLIALCLLTALVSPVALAQDVPPSSGQVVADETTAEPALNPAETLDTVEAALDLLESETEPSVRERLLGEVVSAIGAARQRDAGSPRLLFLAARAHAAAGQTRAAVDELQKYVATREGRNEWRAYRLLGDLLVEQYPQLALANYEKAKALNSAEPSVLMGLAWCASQRGRRAEAVTYARQAVEADGRRTDRFLAALAGFLMADLRWDEAEREGRAALELARDQVRQRPGSRAAAGTLEARYRFLIQLLQTRVNETTVGPDEYLRLARFVQERAAVATKLAQFDELSVLEAALEALGEDAPPEVLEAYGVALARVERVEDARRIFSRLLEKEPNHVGALEWLFRLKKLAPDPPTSDSPQPRRQGPQSRPATRRLP